MQTYEGFLDIFRKKLPEEVEKLGNVISVFVSKNIGDWQCRLYKYRTKSDLSFQNKIVIKQGLEIITITIDPMDMGSDIRFTGLYYNPETKLTMIDFVPYKSDKLDKLGEFLSHIINKYASDKRNYISTMKEGSRFWIELKDIEDIIKDINQDDFDMFSDAKKYNL